MGVQSTDCVLIRGRREAAVRRQLQGAERAGYESARDLPSFRGKLLNFHTKMIVGGLPGTAPIPKKDVQWIREQRRCVSSP